MRYRDLTSDACLFLFFLLLTPASPACRKGTVDECKRAEFVPGFNYTGSGFDVLTLSIILGNWTDGDRRNTINGLCTLCENPLLAGKPYQKLPLAVTNWSARVSCEQEVQYSVHQTAISLAEALTELQVRNYWGNELDLTLTSEKMVVEHTLTGSLSEMVRSCVWKSSRDKYTFFLHHISCSYYKFQVSKAPLLSDHFKRSVKQLPKQYGPNSKMEYLGFIAEHGTHIGTELDLGAHLRYLSAVPVCKAMLEGISISELIRCQAIEVGLAFGLEGVANSPDFQMCEERKKNPTFSLLLVSERREERWGGRIPFLTPKDWLESAKSTPALLSSSLEPLHTFVAKANPRREGLRQAVSEYTIENVLWRDCFKPCPTGSKPSATEFCSCVCPDNNFTNSMCCPQKQGLAKLMVTIVYASDLLGDYITETDAYVVVIFQNRRFCTHTVWNDNHPMWNVNFNFGVVQLHGLDKLRLEIWDEDYGWDDDLIGKCDLILKSWSYEAQRCHLDPGHLYVKYRLACAPNLGGPFCSDYTSLWLREDKEDEDDFFH